MQRFTKFSVFSGIGLAALSVGLALGALPAAAQDKPEVLLPPGFDKPNKQPATTQKPRTEPKASEENKPAAQVRPAEQGGPGALYVPDSAADDVPDVKLSVPVAPSSDGKTPLPQTRSDTNSAGLAAVKSDDAQADSELETTADPLSGLVQVTFDVPAAAARSLANIGLIESPETPFGPDAFGARGGKWVHAYMQAMDAPLVSRWATIMGRRLLSTRLDTPDNLTGQEFTADRAWLLLKMGEVNLARALVQQVEVGNLTEPMYNVLLPVQLAAADPAGACPMLQSAVSATKSKKWRAMRPICASLSGEQSRADALYRNTRDQKDVAGIDLLLTEKLVGVSSKRRAVTIDWTDIKGMNVWRHGMALTTGLIPPERLYDTVGEQTKSWLAVSPVLPARERARWALIAAGMGNLSNDAIVSLYSEAATSPDSSEQVLQRASDLETAYMGKSRNARLKALAAFWPEKADAVGRSAYGGLVLVSRAAAAIAPVADLDAGQADWLIAAMFSSGLDRQAARWSGSVDEGSLGWALIMAGAPEIKRVDAGAAGDFADDVNKSKAALFIGGLAGLGRLDPAGFADISADLNINFAKSTRYTQLLDDAAGKGEKGTVVLLAMSALQGDDWSKVGPHHFFHLIRALRTVGLEAEARMIVAEAVTRA